MIMINIHQAREHSFSEGEISQKHQTSDCKEKQTKHWEQDNPDSDSENIDTQVCIPSMGTQINQTGREKDPVQQNNNDPSKSETSL